MNIEQLANSFNQNIFTDISITLKDANQSIHFNAHRHILSSNNYFKNLLTNPLKEKNANELTLEVFNVNICRDIIMSFYGIPINFTNYRYILEYIKCCDYWLIPYQDVLIDDLKVPEEDFDLLSEIGELMNYSDQILKIISRNIPLEYDLSGIPNELKKRMISLNQKNYLASSGGDSQIKIWDLESGTVVNTLNGDDYQVLSVCYIPEKNQIVSGSINNTIKIWDLESSTLIKTLFAQTDWVYSVCYIMETNQILSSCNNGKIKIWDLDSGALIKTLIGHANQVHSICYIRGKNQIASASADNTIKIWNLDSGALIRTLDGHTSWVFSVCYIPEKNMIVSSSNDNKIKIWDLNTGTEIKTLDGHTSAVRSVCFIPEKNQIASCSDDHTIKIWDLDSGKESFGFQPGSGLCPAGAEVKTLIGHTDTVWRVCYIPEKNQIASGSSDKIIKIWDLESGTVIKTLTGDFKIFDICHIQIESDVAKRLKN